MVDEPRHLLAIAGVLILLSATVSPLLARAFCVRPAPRWARVWRDVALALVGARIVIAAVEGRPAEWWGSALYAHLALCGVAIAAWNVRHSLGPNGDRCPPA